MSRSRVLLTALCVCAGLGLAWRSPGSGETALAAEQTAAPVTKPGSPKVPNSITGEGLPNPDPEGHQELGSAAGRPHLGHVGGHRHRPEGRPHLGLRALRRRRGRRSGRWPVDCDNNPVDPVFKFDRNTGAVLANIGKGVMVTPHGIDARFPGQRLDRRLRRQQGWHQGAPGPQVQPQGREAAEPRHGRQARQRRRPVQPAQRRRHRARRQHLRLRRARRPGHDHRRRQSPRGSSAAPPPASASSRPRASSSSRGAASASSTASSARRTRWCSTARAGCGSPTAAITASRSSTRRASTWSRATPMDASAASSSRRHRSTRSTRNRGRSTTSAGATACASARSTRTASPAFVPPFEREDRVYQGTAGRRRGGGRRRQRLRRRRPELADPGGRRVHEVLRQVISWGLGDRGLGLAAQTR